jgi:hypothetical protein
MAFRMMESLFSTLLSEVPSWAHDRGIAGRRGGLDREVLQSTAAELDPGLS